MFDNLINHQIINKIRKKSSFYIIIQYIFESITINNLFIFELSINKIYCKKNMNNVNNLINLFFKDIYFNKCIINTIIELERIKIFRILITFLHEKLKLKQKNIICAKFIEKM